MKTAFALFALLFSLYVYTAGPSVVPYRDAGEMATAVPTLGVLHPTSYPAYSILGKLAVSVPLGNPAYRLNVFSALAMAAALTVLFTVLRRRSTLLPSLLATVWAGVSYYLWWHALVSEMYALNILFLSALIWAWAEQQFLLFCLLFGVALSNRSDLLLTAPAFALAWGVDRDRRAGLTARHLWAGGALLVSGLALYLYLPLRALQHPVMNWNDPSTIEALMRSLLRRGYGSGLDLLSENYQSGENFLAQLTLYAQHLWRDFAYIGVPIASLGLYSLARRDRSLLTLIVMGWLLTGPLFFWMGNLPTNSHALAIMEAAYLVPDLFFAIALASGVQQLLRWGDRGVGKWGAVSLVGVAIVFTAVRTYPDVNKRSNFLAVDLIRHVYRSAPPLALIVSRKDVPLFSLYYGHWIAPADATRTPIAQGLVRSPWYQRMMQQKDRGLWLGPLNNEADWGLFAQNNPGRPVIALQDIDWPVEGLRHFVAQGIGSRWESNLPTTAQVAAAKIQSLHRLRDLYAYRGVYRYGAYRDFFSNEMTEYYAKAWMGLGTEEGFLNAWRLKPDWPYPPLQLGYIQYGRGDFQRAEGYYQSSVTAFEAYERLAEDWKALPAVRRDLQNDHRMAQANLAVIREKLKNRKSL